MSCNCSSEELHRFTISGQGGTCVVSPQGGSPLPDNEVEITLASSGPDCCKLEFQAGSPILAPRPPSGSWICAQSPAPGGQGSLVWMKWEVPHQSNASQELTWELDNGSDPCTLKIIIKRG
jgi:hypothetical protein